MIFFRLLTTAFVVVAAYNAAETLKPHWFAALALNFCCFLMILFPEKK